MSKGETTNLQVETELEELREKVARLEEERQNYRAADSFLTMADAAASLIFVFRGSEFLYVNPAACRLVGWTEEELRNKELFELVDPAFRNEMKDRLMRWLQGESVPSRSEFRILTSDGDTRWINADATFIKFAGLDAIVCIAYDCTDHKRDELALSQSEQRYRSIIETTQEAIWVVDPIAKTTYANQRLVDMLGYCKEELIGHSVFDFVGAEDRTQVRQALESGRSGNKEQGQFRFIRKDGKELWTVVSTTPLFDSAGAFIGGLAMLIDDTKRKHAEVALKESEERWRTYIEQANDLIFVLDPAGRITSANRAACDTIGYEMNELLGRSPLDFVAEDQRSRAARDLESVLSGREIGRSEIDVLARDGRRISLEARGRILFEEGKVSGVFEIARDITQRKETEAALKQSRALLRATIENLPLELWARDLEGRCILQNPYSTLQWGEQIGKTVDDLPLSPFVREVWRASHERARSGEVIKTEFEIEEDDQAGCYYRVVAPIIVDAEVRATLSVNVDITDRKRAEESLRQSESKFRALAESTAAGIFIYQGSKFVYVNPMTQVHTGYTPAELLDGSFWNVVHPDFRQLVKDRGLARQQGRQQPERYEFKILTKSGETRWVDTTASSLDYDGKPAVIGTAFDITDRKRAEESLRETQRRLHHVLLYSPALLYSLKVTNGRLETDWVSDSLTKLTGYTAEEAFAETWWIDNIHDDDRERARAMISRLVAENRVVSEYRFRHKSQGYMWIHDELRLLRDDDGNPIEAIGTWIDVTERRETEVALRDSEERFRTLVSSMDDMVFTIDIDGRLSGLFGRWIEEAGIDRDAVLNKTALELFGSDSGEAHEKANRLALSGGRVIYESPLVIGDKRYEFQFSLSPIHDHLGVVTGLVGVGRDITEQKRLDRALRESQDRFRSFMHNMPGYAWMKNMDGQYVYLNERLRETLKEHRDDWHGRTDLEVFPEEIALEFQRNDRIVIQNQQAIQILESWELNGMPRYALVTKFPIFNERGETVFVGGASIDVTERKHAEDELLRQKEILQKIFDHIPVMIRFRDEEGRLKLVNREWVRTLGWGLEEARDQDPDILVEAYPDPRYREEVLKFMRESTGEWGRFRTRTKGGEFIDTTWASINLSDGTGIGFGRDITAENRANELLQKKTAELAALHEIELEISAESDLPSVLDVVIQRVSELLACAHCSIYIMEADQTLRLAASLDSELIGSKLSMGEGLAGRVAQSERLESIDDYVTWVGRVAAFDRLNFGPSLGVPLKHQQTVIGAISLSRRPGEDKFTHDDAQLLEQLAGAAAIAIHQRRLFDEAREARERLRELSHSLIEAQESERQRIARELHDQIGQALTAVQISIQQAQAFTDDKSAAELDECLVVIDEAVQQVHDLSLDLRPSMLDDLGLVAALKWYVDRVAARSGLQQLFSADVLEARLSPEVETACFRIAQEALTNLVRHAHARRVWVQVQRERHQFKLLVTDDGMGFDAKAALAQTGAHISLGLQGMQERAVAVGGRVSLKARSGFGTTVEAVFPLREAP